MHNAPPVVYPVGRFVWGRWILMGASMVAAWGVWMAQAQAEPLWRLCGVALWCLGVVGAVFMGSREFLNQGSLMWQGDAWCWRDRLGHEWPVELQVVTDLGVALALRVQLPKDSGLWPWQYAWLSRRSNPSQWHGLRCAVFARVTLQPEKSPLKVR